jgi:hypothetical protein
MGDARRSPIPVKPPRREYGMPERSDWLLLALAHRKGKPLTPAQVQKAMFVLGAEFPRVVGPNFYAFVPYNYGPFDADVYRDLDAFARRGLVTIDGSGSGRSYAATAEGVEASLEIERQLTASTRTAHEYLRRVVDWAASLTFAELVRAIYAR